MSRGRGHIDRISTLLGQNPTYASMWPTKKSKEGRENIERQQTLSLRVRFSSPKRQYHPIRILPLRCRNSLSTSCRLYNRVINSQGGICSGCGCIPWFLTKVLLKLKLCISSSSMNINSLSINSFLLLPIECPSVFLPLISNFTCTHTRSILRQLIVKSSSYFEFYLHPRLLAKHKWCKYNKDPTGSSIRTYNLSIRLRGSVSWTQLV